MILAQHFAALDPDSTPPEEDLLASALGVISYSAQWLTIRSVVDEPKVIRHLRSEFLRLHRKAKP